jgi:hypothetical protein
MASISYIWSWCVSSDFADLSALNERVLLGKPVLVLLLVVESALVILSVTMLAAEHVLALAWEAK